MLRAPRGRHPGAAIPPAVCDRDRLQDRSGGHACWAAGCRRVGLGAVCARSVRVGNKWQKCVHVARLDGSDCRVHERAPGGRACSGERRRSGRRWWQHWRRPLGRNVSRHGGYGGLRPCGGQHLRARTRRGGGGRRRSRFIASTRRGENKHAHDEEHANHATSVGAADRRARPNKKRGHLAVAPSSVLDRPEGRPVRSS